MADLTGKMALVTGASRGIGREIALKLAKNGAKIACVANEDMSETVAAIEAIGGEAAAWICDVTDTDDVKKVVTEAVEKFGSIDVLVNNAGITRDGLLVRMSDDDWDLVLNVNLKGAFAFLRIAAKFMMKQRSGSIVNIASVSGIMGNPAQANYSASKAGLIGLTKTAAKELGGRGVTVNAVAPGFIETDMTKSLPEKVIEGAKQLSPLGRLGQPEEVADAVLFLAGGEASFITGHVLTVDGGMTM